MTKTPAPARPITPHPPTSHGPARPTLCEVRVGPEAMPDGAPLPPRRFPTAARVALGLPMMVLATVAPALATAVPGIGAALSSPSDVRAVCVALLAFALAPLTAVGAVRLVMRFVDRRPSRDAGLVLSRRSLPAFAIGVLVTAAVTLAVGVAASAVLPVRPVDVGSITHGHPWWVVAAVGAGMAFLLQGIPEEIIWRGYVVQTQTCSPVRAVVVSASVFALCHLVSKGGQEGLWEHVLYLAMPFGFALLAGALVLRTGSLWAAAGVHGGFHTGSQIGVLWLGVGNGPALWLAEGLVLAALAVLVLRVTAARTDSGLARPRRPVV